MYLRLYSLAQNLINPLSSSTIIYVHNTHIEYICYNICAEYLTFLHRMRRTLTDIYVYRIVCAIMDIANFCKKLTECGQKHNVYESTLNMNRR